MDPYGGGPCRCDVQRKRPRRCPVRSEDRAGQTGWIFSVHATVEVQQNDKDAKSGTQSSVNFSVDVAVDAGGLHVSYAPSLLARLKAEQAIVTKKEQRRPLEHAVREMDAASVTGQLNYAPTLLELLRGATLLGERRVTLEGRPARLLTVKRTLPETEKPPIGSFDFSEEGFSIWIDDDNFPLAAESRQKLKARILLIKAEGTAATHRTFARKDDRLVVVRMETSHQESGMGQNTSGTAATTVALRD